MTTQRRQYGTMPRITHRVDRDALGETGLPSIRHLYPILVGIPDMGWELGSSPGGTANPVSERALR